MSAAVAAGARITGRARTVELPVRPRPRGGDNWHVHATADGRSIFVHVDALRTVRATERGHSPDETGGLLLGRAFRDADGRYVLVTSAEPPRGREVEGSRAAVRITAAGSAAMERRAQTREPAAEVVGWFHTHPTYPAYFSGVDREEQAQWPFALSVGLVISGEHEADSPEEYAVFVGPRASPAAPVEMQNASASAPVRPEPALSAAGARRRERLPSARRGRPGGPRARVGRRPCAAPRAVQLRGSRWATVAVAACAAVLVVVLLEVALLGAGRDGERSTRGTAPTPAPWPGRAWPGFPRQSELLQLLEGWAR